MSDFYPAKTRAKPIHREGILQKHIRLFACDAIDERHEFLAFDRAGAHGRFSHMREKSQGLRRGNADTLLRVLGIPPMWVEVKWGSNTPDDYQISFGIAMTAVGDTWNWCKSVEEYRQILISRGVPLRRLSELYAEDHDRRVLAEIAREEAKQGKTTKASKPRAVKPTPSHIRRTEAVRGRIRF